jgi:hypothetical protein
MYRH